MINKMFSRLALVITSILLVACAPEKKPSQTSASSEATAEAGQDTARWQSVYFEWSASENYTEGACAEGRVTIKSDST